MKLKSYLLLLLTLLMALGCSSGDGNEPEENGSENGNGEENGSEAGVEFSCHAVSVDDMELKLYFIDSKTTQPLEKNLSVELGLPDAEVLNILSEDNKLYITSKALNTSSCDAWIKNLSNGNLLEKSNYCVGDESDIFSFRKNFATSNALYYQYLKGEFLKDIWIGLVDLESGEKRDIFLYEGDDFGLKGLGSSDKIVIEYFKDEQTFFAIIDTQQKQLIGTINNPNKFVKSSTLLNGKLVIFYFDGSFEVYNLSSLSIEKTGNYPVNQFGKFGLFKSSGFESQILVEASTIQPGPLSYNLALFNIVNGEIIPLDLNEIREQMTKAPYNVLFSGFVNGAYEIDFGKELLYVGFQYNDNGILNGGVVTFNFDLKIEKIDYIKGKPVLIIPKS